MPSAPPSSIEHMAGGRPRYAMSVRRQLNRQIHQQQPGDDDQCCHTRFAPNFSPSSVSIGAAQITGVTAIATHSREVTGNVVPRRDLAQHRRLVPAPPLHQLATRGIGTAGTVGFAGRRWDRGAALGPATAGDEAGNLILERLRVGMARCGQHRARRPGLDDGAAIHHGKPRRDVVDDGEVVADQEIGHAVPRLELLEEVQHLRLHRDVERRDRLVGDDQLRPCDEGAGDGDALTLPAGEFMRVFLAVTALEADRLECLGDAFGARRPGGGDRIEGLGDDARDRLPRVERAVASGRSSAMTRRASVDFPEPDSPTMPRLLPASSTRSTPATAATWAGRRHGTRRGCR